MHDHARVGPRGRPRHGSHPSASPNEPVIHGKDDDGADYRDDHAPEVEACDPGDTEDVEEKAADERADDTDNDVESDTLAPLVDYFARDEARDQPQHDPSDDAHVTIPF